MFARGRDRLCQRRSAWYQIRVLQSNLGTLVRRGKKYGLPDPVRRYAFGDPVSRPNPNSVSGGFTPHAMTYSPFNYDQSCKSASDVMTDIKLIASKNVQSVQRAVHRRSGAETRRYETHIRVLHEQRGDR